MNAPPTPWPKTPDETAIENLGVGFLAFGGLALIVGLYLALYVVLLAFMGLTAAFLTPRSDIETAAIAIGSIAGVVLYLGAVVSFAGLLAYTGQSMRLRRRYRLCLTAASIACIGFPLGTLLGGWALVILRRPAVRALFL